LRAGETVTPNSIILVMSNPDVQQRAIDAELQLKGAEADLANLQATLQSQILNSRQRRPASSPTTTARSWTSKRTGNSPRTV